MDAHLSALDYYFRFLGAVRLLDAEDEVRLGQTMEAGRAAAARIVGQQSKPAMSLRERVRLQQLEEAGLLARDRFIVANLRLVARVATDMPRIGAVDLADRIQDGNMGLIRAVDRFDWRRGFRFSTYALLWIRQAIQRGAARTERTVPLPYAVHAATLKVSAASSEWLARTGLQPTISELTGATHLTESMVRRALAAPTSATVYARVGTDANGWESRGRMAVADDDPAGDAIQRLAFEQVLRTARSTLDEASNRALRLRFGLDGDEPMSYEEIAAQLGLSRETTRTMIARALARLRGLMTEDQWPPLTG